MRTVVLSLAAGLIVTTGAWGAGQQLKTADYHFAYTYPDSANRYPGLRSYFTTDLRRTRAELIGSVKGARAEATRSGYPFNPYETTVEWKVVTDTPRLLSLSADRYGFTGGAHGTPASDSLLWDKQAGRTLRPAGVFTSVTALEAAARPAYCRQLAALQTARRGGPTAPDAMFGACPPFKELTVLLGSSGGGRIDRIGLIADAYVAGPYAEGEYEVTVPVTPDVLRAVQPGYRAAFASR